MTNPPETIALLGLGLMGGSLGLALKRAETGVTVRGYARRDITRRQALDHGVIDEAFDDPAEAVQGADIAVLCVPVLATMDVACRAAAGASPSCIFTDVGSTKADIMREVAQSPDLSEITFIGSHPIAGSHETGIEAAREDLYKDALVVVTPPDGMAPDASRALERLWTTVGARVATMTAEAHDAILARTSHLPHLVAAALVESVLGGDASTAGFCGSGFRDTTRVAEGDEALWRDICVTNRSDILAALRELRVVLDHVGELLESGDDGSLEAFLSTARRRRELLSGERGAQ